MEPRISLATLAVADLERAAAFYQGLGWTPGFANDEVCFFQLRGLVLGLWSRASMAKELGIPEEELRPGGMELAHNVRRKGDVDHVLAKAVAAGGRSLLPAHDAAWGGRTGHFTDPDGYRWEVAWNPAWTVTAEGATLMDSST